MSGHLPSPGRIAVIGRHTFTQLVRMKVFYFLAIFALVVLGANSLDLPATSGPEAVGEQELFALKNTSLGCMSIFSLVLAIVATGLLLPKDVEDRTLYTILAKPVPRLDYLAGKLLGVAAVIFVSLLAMDLLMTAVLHFRTGAIVESQLRFAESAGYDAGTTAALERGTRRLGPTWNLQSAVWLVFLRAMVMAAVAMLLSTLSTSTLFTAVVGFMVLFGGFFQADAREFYFAGTGGAGRLGSALVSLVLPDLQLFNAIDAIIEGKLLAAADVLKISGVAVFYLVLYGFCSWLVFARKEF